MQINGQETCASAGVCAVECECDVHTHAPSMCGEVDLNGRHHGTRVRGHGSALSVCLVLSKNTSAIQVQRLVVPDGMCSQSCKRTRPQCLSAQLLR